MSDPLEAFRTMEGVSALLGHRAEACEEEELEPCDGCGEPSERLLAVYEGDDPSVGYHGSPDPEYLCWECRHPHAAQIVADERAANERAMRILGIEPDPEPLPMASLTLAEKLVASIAIAKYRKETA
jgi:hypothetical protein